MMRRLKGLTQDEIVILKRTFDMSYLNYMATLESSAYGMAYPECRTRDATPVPGFPSCAIQVDCGREKAL